MDIAARTWELIGDVVSESGFELVHVEYQPRGSESILRVYIDKPGGVGLDDCRAVSRHVSVLLDVEDFIPNQYVLEVSSPGLHRPLFKKTDFVRFAGREVRIILTEKLDGRRKFSGILKGMLEDEVLVDVDGTERRLPRQSIKKANLVYRFDQEPAR